MKIEVNIEKKYAFLIVGVILALGFGVFVYAFTTDGGGTPSNMGHSVGEIDWGKSIGQQLVIGGDRMNINSPVRSWVIWKRNATAAGDATRDNFLFFAPETDIIPGSWDWSNAVMFTQNGGVYANGFGSYGDICTYDKATGTQTKCLGSIEAPDSGTWQKRVSGSCGVGYAIRSIDVNGAVTCQPVTPLICTYKNIDYGIGTLCFHGSTFGACRYCILNTDNGIVTWAPWSDCQSVCP